MYVDKFQYWSHNFNTYYIEVFKKSIIYIYNINKSQYWSHNLNTIRLAQLIFD